MCSMTPDLPADVRHLFTAIDHVGIASDFDGGGAVTGWMDASETRNVTEGLRRRGFSEADIAKMKRAQDNVFSMLSGVDSLDQLNLDQKTSLSNSLDVIKATLLSDEGNRLICHRERKIGTNIVAKRCETVAERNQHAKESQEQMREMAPTMQTKSGG